MPSSISPMRRGVLVLDDCSTVGSVANHSAKVFESLLDDLRVGWLLVVLKPPVVASTFKSIPLRRYREDDIRPVTVFSVSSEAYGI